MADGRHDILSHLKSLFSKERDNDDSLQIMEYFPSLLYVMDLGQNKITYINQGRISDALGFTHDEIQSWNCDIMKMIFKEDEERVRKEFARYLDLDDDADHSFESRLNHKEEEWRYFRTRGRVLRRDAAGVPMSLLFVSEDITTETKSREEILALKQLVDDTEELLLCASWAFDPETEMFSWTDGMYSLLEYERTDTKHVIPFSFYLKHLSAEDGRALRNAITNAKTQKESFEIKYHLTTHKGTTKFISTKGKPVLSEEGKLIKLVGITRDITRQTKINRDLQNYRSTILEKEEFLNQGSWQIDLFTGAMTWSHGMVRLFGYTDDTEQAATAIMKLLEVNLVDDAGVLLPREKLRSGFLNADHYTTEESIITRDGQGRQLETFVKVIKNHLNIPESLIGTCRDITQLKEYERSLEEKIQELKRSNQELEEFAYVASHDLQEPLRKLTTFSERLQSKFTHVLGPDGILYLDRIVAATANMRLLIDNLLDFSRTATSGKHFISTNLNDLLKESLSGLELKIEETGAVITAATLPVVEVIPTQVKQLFDNLLNNSIKFKQKDKAPVISISCEAASPKEVNEMSLKPEKNYYKFEVRDNGIGFEGEYQERIFLIFQRLHGKSEYPGSGIGLAICKKIVENHNGVIFARGNPGQGATFTFYLPDNQS